LQSEQLTRRSGKFHASEPLVVAMFDCRQAIRTLAVVRKSTKKNTSLTVIFYLNICNS